MEQGPDMCKSGVELRTFSFSATLSL